MTKSLLKYDLKNMTKVLIYLYIIAVGLSGLTRLINIGSNIQTIAIIGYVFSGLTYSAIGSILVNTFVHILKVFVCNFYKDESYLTHTLPVSKKQLLLSKFLASLIVILASVFVCVLCFFILFYSPAFMQSIKGFISTAVAGFNLPVWVFVLLIIAVVFSQTCAIVSMAFSAVVKANTYNHKRAIKGLLWFALYYFVSLMVTLLLVLLAFAVTGNISQFLATTLSQGAIIGILLVGLLAYVAYSFIFYFICQKLFGKGVNVD